MYTDYEQLSEIKQYIKSLFKSITDLEERKNVQQEELFDRIIYLLELYINQEVEVYIKKQLPEIVERVVLELRKEISSGVLHGRK